MRSSFDGFDVLAGPGWTEADEKKQDAANKKNRRKTAPAAPAAPPVLAFDPAAWMADFLQAQRRAREQAYQAAARGQRQSYEFARTQVDDGTDRALREAYINKMIGLRDLPDQLAAQGLSGGSSETALAGLYNNYGNARNGLETERQRQMAALLNTYQQNMANLEAQRAEGGAADLARLIPQLVPLAKLGALNAPVAVTLTQGQSPQAAADAAMRRLRRALGLEEEE